MVFAGCRPKGILSSKQMRDVLYDLHRADAILKHSDLDYGHDEELAKYYEVVLEKHKITQAQFDSSLVWYTDHPARFDKIYPKIVQRCKEEYNEVMKTLETSSEQGAEERQMPSIEEVQKRYLYGLPTELWEQPKSTAPIPYRSENE